MDLTKLAAAWSASGMLGVAAVALGTSVALATLDLRPEAREAITVSPVPANTTNAPLQLPSAYATSRPSEAATQLPLASSSPTGPVTAQPVPAPNTDAISGSSGSRTATPIGASAAPVGEASQAGPSDTLAPVVTFGAAETASAAQTPTRGETNLMATVKPTTSATPSATKTKK